MVYHQVLGNSIIVIIIFVRLFHRLDEPNDLKRVVEIYKCSRYSRFSTKSFSILKMKFQALVITLSFLTLASASSGFKRINRNSSHQHVQRSNGNSPAVVTDYGTWIGSKSSLIDIPNFSLTLNITIRIIKQH
jgi:hypothetical protein